MQATKEYVFPKLEGKLKEIDNNREEREKLIILGLTDFGFLISNGETFRLGDLAQKIKEYTTDKKAHLIADVMIVNSFFYLPWVKKNNEMNQIG